jgi:hypothetical protein
MDMGITMQYVPFVMFVTSILIGATIGIAERSRAIMIHTTIKYMMLLTIGASGLWSFLGNTLFAHTIASHLEWSMCPFQFESACAHLALGIAGLIGFKKASEYWWALTIAVTVFYWGTALNYIYHIIFTSTTFSAVEMTLYMNIVTPIILNALLWYHTPIKRPTT